jgi:tetratricopeptide (TPR) repeat protein
MKTIFADYDARTEAGDICLTTRGSREDVERLGAQPGDWTWLSDGEVVVGAQLAIDNRYGLVGVPDWDTITHLDDEGADDFEQVQGLLLPLLSEAAPSESEEPRILQLLTQLERVAPPQMLAASRGAFPFRRALALRQMDKLGLALLEAREARRIAPENPDHAFVYLDLLRIEDLPSAVAETQQMAESPGLPALVLSGCINILATRAEQAAAADFEPLAERVLDWCRRLDQAPDRDQAGESLLALAHFNRGLVMLRSGRISQARQAFAEAHRLYPAGPMIEEVAALRTYDHHARELARRMRVIAETFPHRPVAA